MTDNASFAAGKLTTDLTFAMKDVGGVLHSKGMLVDSLGNDVTYPGLEGLYQSAFFGGTPTTYANGDMAKLQTNAYGALRVSMVWGNGREAKGLRTDLAIAPTAIDSSDTLQTQGALGYSYDATATKLRPDAVPSKITRLLSAAASDNATLCASVATNLVRIKGFNASASARWLKIYDKATAPTSADTPILTEYIAPSVAFSFMYDMLALQVGLGFRITTGSADNDTGALTAADILGMNVVRTH